MFEHGLVAMLAGGFAVTGAGIAPLAWADYRGTTCSDTPMWIGLFTGLALWCIGPVLPILGGMEWTDWTGGGTYRMPLWGGAAGSYQLPMGEYTLLCDFVDQPETEGYAWACEAPAHLGWVRPTAAKPMPWHTVRAVIPRSTLCSATPASARPTACPPTG